MPTRWYCHYCWTWSSILKVLKAISLQYLYNISKKKLGREFIFCMQMNKVSTRWNYWFIVFVGSCQICLKYPTEEVGNNFAKIVAAAFVFYSDAKHSDILRGPSIFIVIYLFPCTVRLESFCLNTTIQQLNSIYVGERGVSFFVVFALSWYFSIETGYITANHPMSIKQAKKKIVAGLLIQFHPNSYKKVPQYCNWKSISLCDKEISWTPTLAGVSYQFGFVPFPICLQCKIISFFCFFLMKFHIIK